MSIRTNITHRIRRLISGTREPNALVQLQAHLNQTHGGGIIPCPRCRGIVTPIFNVFPDQAELVGLACTACHGITILDECGAINFREPDAPPTHATIH